jgi:hypothetical protein
MGHSRPQQRKRHAGELEQWRRCCRDRQDSRDHLFTWEIGETAPTRGLGISLESQELEKEPEMKEWQTLSYSKGSALLFAATRVCHSFQRIGFWTVSQQVAEREEDQRKTQRSKAVSIDHKGGPLPRLSRRGKACACCKALNYSRDRAGDWGCTDGSQRD